MEDIADDENARSEGGLVLDALARKIHKRGTQLRIS